MTGREDGPSGNTPGWRVRVIVDGRADATSVGRHLERFGCRVVELRPRGLLVEFPNAAGRDDAESEARLYLAMWHARHPRDEGELPAALSPEAPRRRPLIRRRGSRPASEPSAPSS